MESHWLFRKLDELWLGTKIFAAQGIALTFAVAAALAFGMIAFEVGVEGLRWLQTGSWTSSKPIAEAFPVASEMVAALAWVDAQRVGMWALSHSVLWLYAALGIVCFVICGIFLEIGDHLQSRRRYLHQRGPDSYGDRLVESRLRGEQETPSQGKGSTAEGTTEPPRVGRSALIGVIARRRRPTSYDS